MPKDPVSVRAFRRPDNGRTTIKLERSIWKMLDEVAKYQGRTYTDVLNDIENSRGQTERTIAIRSFILYHFYERAVSSQRTMEGHPKLGMPSQSNHVQVVISPLSKMFSTRDQQGLPSNVTSAPEPEITEYDQIYID